MMRSIRLATFAVGICFAGIVPRAPAAMISYTAVLNGSSESPPNTSAGTGSALVVVDDVANTLRVQVSFSGLSSGTTMAHIHAPTPTPGAGTAGVAVTTPSFPDFPLGVTSGVYDHTFDLTSASSYNPAYVTANGGTAAGAEAALLAALAADEAYVNIHSTAFPAGEIRGFLQPIPEPAGLVLAAVGGLSVLAARAPRRRR